MIVFGIQVFNKYQTSNHELTATQILVNVNKIMILPTGEEPVIKTVTNLDEVNYQPFFMNAAVGDQVIIYSIAKKAVLYRPSTNKVIEASNLK